MAKCACCGKGVTFGIKVSHSHRRSNRTWNPNVKRVKAVVDGSPRGLIKTQKIAGHSWWPAFLRAFYKRVPVAVRGCLGSAFLIFIRMYLIRYALGGCYAAS